jgi:hypothetical protein
VPASGVAADGLGVIIGVSGSGGGMAAGGINLQLVQFPRDGEEG